MIPDFQTLMLPALQVAAAGEVRIGDAVESLATKFALTDEERSALLPSGRQTTFANRIHWAKTHLARIMQPSDEIGRTLREVG
jgi:restriction system protein